MPSPSGRLSHPVPYATSRRALMTQETGDVGPSGMLSPRRILVGLDGSRASVIGLRVAARMARETGASLSAVHVVVPQEPVAFDLPWVATRTAEHMRHAGEEILAEARRVAGQVLTATELHVGSPAQVICRRATELEVDLVILGGRSQDPASRSGGRSVSAAVAAEAPCSVLVVRRPADTDLAGG